MTLDDEKDEAERSLDRGKLRWTILVDGFRRPVNRGAERRTSILTTVRYPDELQSEEVKISL